MIELALLAAGVRLAIPLAFASMGELLAERSGVINIGIEGMMLVGAFFAFWGNFATGSALLGVLCGVGAAMAVALLFALLCVLLPCDQIVAGTGINLFALGLTGFLFRTFFGVHTRVPIDQAPIFPFELLLAFIFAALLLLFYGTYPGLAMRVAGETPLAAETVGFSVRRLRLGAVLFGGGMAGLAGAYLSTVHATAFTEGMTAGRGFIALAIVIFGRWHPIGVVAASLFFGLALAFQYQWQASGSALPYQLVRMSPYLLTLFVLALLGQKKGGAPAALGEPFNRNTSS